MEEQVLVEKIGVLLARFENKIPLEDISEAKNLFEHDEWEMAFEILLIGLIGSEIVISDDEKSELEELAIDCNLKDEGGVSDYYIWDKFLKWTERPTT